MSLQPDLLTVYIIVAAALFYSLGKVVRQFRIAEQKPECSECPVTKPDSSKNST